MAFFFASTFASFFPWTLGLTHGNIRFTLGAEAESTKRNLEKKKMDDLKLIEQDLNAYFAFFFFFTCFAFPKILSF
jgi:hypothetical protein